MEMSWRQRTGIGAAVLFVALASAALTARMLLRSRSVSAPELVGSRPVEAYAAASRLGLSLIVASRRHDDAVPEGRIASQEPAAGAPIKTSRSVRVVVSLGPARVNVPPVTGRSLREARLLLEHAGLGSFRVVTTEDTTPAETVVMQEPPAGDAPMTQSMAVTLLVSRGPASADYIMPDLISRPAAATLLALQQAGLRIADVQYRSYPGAPAGVILKQTPLAGFRVTPRTIVAVEVSGSPS